MGKCTGVRCAFAPGTYVIGDMSTIIAEDRSSECFDLLQQGAGVYETIDGLFFAFGFAAAGCDGVDEAARWVYDNDTTAYRIQSNSIGIVHWDLTGGAYYNGVRIIHTVTPILFVANHGVFTIIYDSKTIVIDTRSAGNMSTASSTTCLLTEEYRESESDEDCLDYD